MAAPIVQIGKQALAFLKKARAAQQRASLLAVDSKLIKMIELAIGKVPQGIKKKERSGPRTKFVLPIPKEFETLLKSVQIWTDQFPVAPGTIGDFISGAIITWVYKDAAGTSQQIELGKVYRDSRNRLEYHPN